MTGVCFIVAETDTGTQGDLTHWCDEAAKSICNHSSVLRLNRYMAFNARRCVVVADLSEASDIRPVVPQHSAIRFDVLNGKTASEFTRPNDAVMQSAPILYSIRFSCPPDWSDELDRWYDQEHIPMMMECPDWAGVTRYHVKANQCTHLAFHYIKDARAIDSPALRAARSTPWRDKLAAHDWYAAVDKMYHFKMGPIA